MGSALLRASQILIFAINRRRERDKLENIIYCIKVYEMYVMKN